MKKILIVFSLLLYALLVAPTDCQAQTLGSLDSLYLGAFAQLNIPATGTATVTPAFAKGAVNRGIQAISTIYPAVEKLDTVVADATSKFFALNTDFVAINWVLKFSGDTMTLPLEYTPVDSLFDAYKGITGAKANYQNAAQNPRFAWSGKQKIFFYPKPVLADTFLVSYFAVGRKLTSDTMTTDIQPMYREQVLYYACALIADLQGQKAVATGYYTLSGFGPPQPLAVREEQLKR